MPGEFSVCPLTTDEAVNEWLKFFEVEAPFTCMSVFISNDPVSKIVLFRARLHLLVIVDSVLNLQGLDLRVEHSHGFNEELGLGGHYHNDVTPEEAEYLGYYNLAEGNSIIYTNKIDKIIIVYCTFSCRDL